MSEEIGVREGLDAKSMTIEELTAFFAGRGEKPYRAKQAFAWMHKERVKSWGEMTNLSKALREELEKDPLTVLRVEQVQTSALDGTKKYLFALPDGALVESVLMPYHHGNSVCISSQVGCRMGCSFCASTLGGKERDLLPSEMLEQIYRIGVETGQRVDSVVVMGTGEPMDNYENFVRFVRLLTDPAGQGLSQRSITVSTCGLVPQIYRLAEEGLAITLAISLHAPDDELRKKLMPIAHRYSIDEILSACRTYFQKTGRRVTYEYSLIDGVNDSEEQAYALAERLRGMGGHVNLIPVNPVRERAYRRSALESVARFKNTLENCQINVTIRREMGADIDGACGQLRARALSQRPKNG